MTPPHHPFSIPLPFFAYNPILHPIYPSSLTTSATTYSCLCHVSIFTSSFAQKPRSHPTRLPPLPIYQCTSPTASLNPLLNTALHLTNLAMFLILITPTIPKHITFLSFHSIHHTICAAPPSLSSHSSAYPSISHTLVLFLLDPIQIWLCISSLRILFF